MACSLGGGSQYLSEGSGGSCSGDGTLTGQGTGSQCIGAAAWGHQKFITAMNRQQYRHPRATHENLWWWQFPWMSCPSCCFQHQQRQKMSPLRATGSVKAAKTTRSPEIWPEAPRLLKRYLGRERITIFSEWMVTKLFGDPIFYSRHIWPKKHKSQVLKKKNKTEQENFSAFSCNANAQHHLFTRNKIHFFFPLQNANIYKWVIGVTSGRQNNSPWFISSVTQQIVAKNRWSSQLVLTSIGDKYNHHHQTIFNLCQSFLRQQPPLILMTAPWQALFVPTSEMGKLRLRKVKWLDHDDTHTKGQKQVTHLNFPILAPEPFHRPHFSLTGRTNNGSDSLLQGRMRPKPSERSETSIGWRAVLVPKDGCQRDTVIQAGGDQGRWGVSELL